MRAGAAAAAVAGSAVALQSTTIAEKMFDLKPVTLAEVEQAKINIRDIAVRTPLVKLNWDGAPGIEIYLKLENLQPINSFKVRGAGNALMQADPSQLANGVCTASAGNMAQGVAKQAQILNVPMTAVVPDQAPEAKLQPVERMGGTVIKVPFDEWWKIIQVGPMP
jgi:threonine dehydratase